MSLYHIEWKRMEKLYLYVEKKLWIPLISFVQKKKIKNENLYVS